MFPESYSPESQSTDSKANLMVRAWPEISLTPHSARPFEAGSPFGETSGTVSPFRCSAILAASASIALSWSVLSITLLHPISSMSSAKLFAVYASSPPFVWATWAYLEPVNFSFIIVAITDVCSTMQHIRQTLGGNDVFV